MPVATIVCPKCKAEIPVEEALSHAFREKIEHQAKESFDAEKDFPRRIREKEKET